MYMISTDYNQRLLAEAVQSLQNYAKLPSESVRWVTLHTEVNSILSIAFHLAQRF